MNPILEHIRGRNGALATLSIVTLAFITILALAIGALFDWAEGDTAGTLQQMATYRAQIAERSTIELSLKQAVIRASASPGLLQAPSTALAQATLESTLKDIAKRNGADVRSSEILPARRGQDFEAESVQSDLSVPMSHLRDLVYAIEAHTPYLFIDHATVAAQQNWEPENTAPKDPTLEVRWTVTAYRWAAAK